VKTKRLKKWWHQDLTLGQLIRETKKSVVTSARRKDTTRKIDGVSIRTFDLKGLRELASRPEIGVRGESR
jgi:hypothetical protein